jgi:hypothetical protein
MLRSRVIAGIVLTFSFWLSTGCVGSRRTSIPSPRAAIEAQRSAVTLIASAVPLISCSHSEVGSSTL